MSRGYKCDSCGRSPRIGLVTKGKRTLCADCRATQADTVAARETLSLLPAGVLSLGQLRATVKGLEQELFDLDHSEMPRRSEVIHTQGRLIAAYRAMVMELDPQNRTKE